MTASNDCILFFRFFDPVNDQGQTIPGFFENLDFSGYSQTLAIIQQIAADNINMYLKNEYSRRYVVSTWARYMSWNKAEKRYEIDPAFYTDFSAALCAALLEAENLFQLTQLDLEGIPEIIERVKEWGERHTETKRGNDVTTDDSYQDVTTLDIGKTKTVTDNDYARDHTKTENDYAKDHTKTENDYAKDHTKTENDYAQDHTKTENDYARDHTVTTNTVSAFNSATYQPKDKSDVDRDAHTDEIDVTRDAHTDEIDVTRDARKDEIDVTRDARKDTIDTTRDARKDMVTTNTDARQDTSTFDGGQRKSTEQHGDINTTADEYTDTETITSSGKLDREKLFKIKAELAQLNAYKLIGDAIAKTMLRNDFDYSLDHFGMFFPI
jgi:hypothetical protein